MSSTSKITVLTIDDHQLVLDGLKMLIDSSNTLEFLGMAKSGKEGLKMIKELHPDVVLLDIEMPEMNGIEVCKSIKKSNPEIKIIALTMLIQPSVIEAMIKAGAEGFLVKNTSSDELVFAIQEVYSGESYYCKEVKTAIIKGISIKGKSSSIPSLSRREKEIARLIVDSYSTKDIAAKLFISEGTVETHRKNILRKLGVKNVAGLVKMVIEERLLQP